MKLAVIHALAGPAGGLRRAGTEPAGRWRPQATGGLSDIGRGARGRLRAVRGQAAACRVPTGKGTEAGDRGLGPLACVLQEPSLGSGVPGQGARGQTPTCWWPRGAGCATLTRDPGRAGVRKAPSPGLREGLQLRDPESPTLHLRHVFLQGAGPSFSRTPSLCLGSAPGPQPSGHLPVGTAALGTPGLGSAGGEDLWAAVSTEGLGSDGHVARGPGGGVLGGRAR